MQVTSSVVSPRRLAPSRSPEVLRPASVTLLVFGILAMLYLGTSTQPVIWDETDGQYAGAAKEMLEREDWLVPTNGGIPRLQKPPLVTWAIMASYEVFGVTVFAARVPSALAALGWFFAVYLVGRELGGVIVGRRAAYFLATGLGTFVFCHIIMPEPFLAFFLTLTMWTFLRALRAEEGLISRRWMTAAWVLMALGCLSKGLHGAAIPLLVALFGSFSLPGSGKVWRQLWQPLGPLLFVGILVPWYVAVEWKYPGFIQDHLLNEQLGHVLDNREPPTSTRAPLAPFLLQHFVYFLPWLFWVPSAWIASRLPSDPSSSSSGRFSRLLWIWILITWSTAVVSARQDYYTLNSWGPLAVLIAMGLGSLPQAKLMWRVVPPLLFAFAGLIMASAAGVLTLQMDSLELAGSGNETAPVVEREHVWKAVQGLDSAFWRGQFTSMLWMGVAWLVAGVLAALLSAWRKMEGALLAIVAAMVLTLVLVTQALTAVQNYFSLERIAATINQTATPDAWVVYPGDNHLAASLFFYLDRPVHWLGSSPNLEFAPRAHGVGSEYFVSAGAVKEAWHSPRQVFLIVEETDLDTWRTTFGLSPHQATPLARSGTRLLLVNDLPGNP